MKSSWLAGHSIDDGKQIVWQVTYADVRTGWIGCRWTGIQT